MKTAKNSAPAYIDLRLHVVGEDPLDIPQTRYIRADLVRAAMPENWRNDPTTVVVMEALGVTK